MQTLLIITVSVLTLTLAAGLVRVVIGPAPADRITSALLFGTNGVALLILLAELTEIPAIRDTALVLAALGAIIALAFTRFSPRTEGPPG